ncbi:MAG: glycine--tRNA ligase subunit beta [Thermodesulfobacteriota bacterium]|nr:glycine--tRNA ligase subunit beta [Thermodesulfobacteriota bacterium]
MASDFLLEIGTEEIPSGFIHIALKEMERLFRKELKNQRLGFEDIKTFGTPRRLVLFIDRLSDRQGDIYVEKIGPSKKVAFDNNGNPTNAAIGFAKAQNVSVTDLQQVSLAKGEYLAVKKKEFGLDTRGVLSSLLPRLITSIPFPKSMRWGNSQIRFARPIHWILCLFNGDIVPFWIGNVESKDISFGHRFMAPSPFKVPDFNFYIEYLQNAKVIVDPEERKEIIRKEITEAAAGISGKVLEDEDLLEEVTFLIEYPTSIVGAFDREFLDLPKEVLIASMRKHQMYFSVVDGSGVLLPYFIAVNNTIVKDPEVVVKGNERVLKARLSDAKFFFEEDRKSPLFESVPYLKEIVFQSELGTLYEKVMRLQRLAEYLAVEIKSELEERTKRAAFLCKADLTSKMVGEFPSLQGVMGKEYALFSGEDPEVANAIYEHYLPRFAGDLLPLSDMGAFVSIADRIDTIVACFGVGRIPTGTSDPYALRRQALGVINIILDKRYSISLTELCNRGIEYLNDKISRDPEDVFNEVFEFFRQRFQHHLSAKGYSYDIIDAVLSSYFDEMADTFDRIEALEGLKNQPDFQPLTIAFKRASNIITQSSPAKEVKVSLFKDPSENTLWNAYKEIKESVLELLLKKKYREALYLLVHLREPVDDFFDNVMVMAQDEAVRKNRLAILVQVSELFLNIADFSRIVTV